MKIKIKKRSMKYLLGIMLMFSIFMLPSYLAIDINDSLPMFSVQRIMAIIVVFIYISDFYRFINVLSKTNLLLLILIYVSTTYFSALFSGSILDKTWLGIILEQILIIFIYTYYIRYEVSVDFMLKLLRIFAISLGILGIIEYINGESFYALLETTSREIWTGNFVRGGSYRVMGPFNHALAYGLVLSILIPICCYDEKKKRIDILNRWWLLLLLVVNVFLTGSRSTILVILLEFFLIYIMGDSKNKLKSFFVVCIVLAFIIIFLNVVDNELTRNMWIIIYSITDILFGTSFTTINVYSAETGIGQRLGLFKYFIDNEINPLFGNGFSYSVGHAVDNNYIGQYIKSGWLGLLAFISIILYVTIWVSKRIKTNRVKILTISVIGYAVHLFFVNELHTISAFFIILSMLYSEIYENRELYEKKRI